MLCFILHKCRQLDEEFGPLLMPELTLRPCLTRRFAYRAKMPSRCLLEREFHEAELRLPVRLVETTSAFTTMSLLQTNTAFVAVLPFAVADVCTNQGRATRLALAVTSRSEPYELVTRQGAPVSPGRATAD